MHRIALSTTALIALVAAGSAHAQTGPSPSTMAPAPTVRPGDEPASQATAPAAAPNNGAAPAVADEGGIADIIVTAQRRNERVQNVPIAISAFSAEQLQAQGVSSTLQLGNYVPNLVAQNNTGIGSANAYFLRGLGSTETIATFDPPVGTYVDDIYLSRQNANNLSMFDVQRIEVLRGPQGTLFGRNTTGGAINVIMAEPGKRLGGFGEVGFGSYEKLLFRVSLDAPLGDNFGAKLSGYWQNDLGYVRNTTNNQRLNDDDGWGVRLGLRGKLGPMLTWAGSAMRVVSKGDNVLNFTCNPRAPTECNGRYASTGYSEENGPPSPFLPLVVTGDKANFGLGQKATNDILISKFNAALGAATDLSFITGFVGLSQTFGFDFADGRGFANLLAPRPPVVGNLRGGYVILNDGRHDQFSQEVKLTGNLGGELIKYVAGVFYIHENNRTDLGDIFGGFLVAGDRTVRNKTEALAGYAQADFHVTPQITLTAGLRYTDETKTLNLSDNRASCNVTPLPATCLDNRNLIAVNGKVIPTKLQTKIWTPRFAANFKPSSNILLFASATKGFKSGGWNARQTANSQFLPFGPEKVWSYELGLKSDFLNRRLRFNVTLFHLDVKDLQVLAGALSPSGVPTFITRNFANYRNRGAEIEITAQPIPGLNLYTNIGYQKDRYIIPGGQSAVDEYGVQSVTAQQAACLAALAAGIPPTRPGATTCGNGLVTVDGKIATPVRTPKLTLSLGGSYRMPLGSSGLALTPSVNGSYRTVQEVAIANVSLYDQAFTSGNGTTLSANPYGRGNFISGSRSPGGWLVNSSVTLSGAENRWALSAECNNCFDKAFIQSSLFNYSYLNMPVTWLVRGKYKF